MATVEKPSAREAKRLQTRERLLGAAIAEFKRAGMADADVGSIVEAAGGPHRALLLSFPDQGTCAVGIGAARGGAHRQTARPLSGYFTRAGCHARGGGATHRRPGATPRREPLQRLSGSALLTDPPDGREQRTSGHRAG